MNFGKIEYLTIKLCNRLKITIKMFFNILFQIFVSIF